MRIALVLPLAYLLLFSGSAYAHKTSDGISFTGIVGGDIRSAYVDTLLANSSMKQKGEFRVWIGDTNITLQNHMNGKSVITTLDM